MSDYTLRQLLKEVEWNCRVALATADDLVEAAEADEPDAVPAVVESFAIRSQKVIELLWPGRHRLADRVYAEDSAALRQRLEIDDASPLTHSAAAALYTLIDGDIRAVPRAGGGFPILRGSGADLDLDPLLHELRRVWSRSAEWIG